MADRSVRQRGEARCQHRSASHTDSRGRLSRLPPFSVCPEAGDGLCSEAFRGSGSWAVSSVISEAGGANPSVLGLSPRLSIGRLCPPRLCPQVFRDAGGRVRGL